MKNIILFTLLLTLISCGGSSSGGGSGSSTPVETSNVSVPQEWQKTFTLIYDEIVSGGPFSEDDEISFKVNEDGSVDVTTSSETYKLSNPKEEGAELIWEKDGIKYALSNIQTKEFNEVNISNNTGFLGQFSEKVNLSEGLQLLVDNFGGNWRVTNVAEGTHTRGTVIIDSNGNIDFDTNVSFTASQLNLISDRISVLDSIFVDIAPWPSEPYPRMDFNVETKTIIYRPNYPNGGGAIEVTVELIE